ncbi:MAG: MOSC domain-containing protein [Terriglobia bacterium]
MELISVNVSLPKPMAFQGRTVMTGIFKEPVSGRVRVRRLNLEGDRQADLSVHGGPYQAVYAYPHEHYESWRRELGRDDFTYGQFGENFTVSGMLENQVCIGDAFRIGSALFQVTQPRVPCFKLATKMGSEEFPDLFMESARSGYYLRVMEEGEVGAGDVISQESRSSARMTVESIFRLAFFDRENVAQLREAVCLASLSPDWQHRFELRLEELDGKKTF